MTLFENMLRRRFYRELMNISYHPFNQEMRTGILKREKFLYFLSQDANLYLPRFGQALQSISSSFAAMNEPVLADKFLHLLEINTQYTQNIYDSYPISKASKKLAPSFFQPVPSCLTFAFEQYANHLLRPGSAAEKVARVTACIWLYDQLGNKLSVFECAPDNPYKAWLEGYKAPLSIATTEHFVAAFESVYNAERSSVKKENMLLEFEKSLDIELSVFDGAYIQEPVAQFEKVL